MTYGTKVFKNGKKVGYLHFSTGKTVFMNEKERIEYDQKVADYQYYAKEDAKLEVNN